jgi:acetoin utilization deacetylase AcuC-like enzyme
MVLYDADARIVLSDYGILIPVAPDRSARVFAELSARLADLPAERWQVTPGTDLLTRTDLLRAHDREYVSALLGDGKERVILQAFELIDQNGEPFRYDPSTAIRPLTALVDMMLGWSTRSWQAGVEALHSPGRFCYHLGGGAHHGHRAFGHGFCVVNDIVLAARKLQADGEAQQIWVIDIDAHKGDGTAALTAGDRSITTLSIHMARGWPLDLPRRLSDGSEHPSFTPSDIDIPVAAGEEDAYLSRLHEGLEKLNSYPRADLAYVVGGVDPWEHDELPSTGDLRLSLEQINERDRMVFDFLAAAGIPQAWLMAGGYGARAWEPYPPFLEYAIRATVEP